MLRRPEQFRIDGRRRSSDPFPERSSRSGELRYTLGSIIWYALLRLVATIAIAWYVKDRMDLVYGEWWSITMLSLYGVVIYPAQIQYRHFKKTSRRLIEQTLCSSCRHFNPEGLHCMMLDDHVSEFHLPCEGEGWEPKSYEEV